MIAHYKLLEHIGTGPLGAVHRARDTKLGRTVALKLPPPELTTDPIRREALLRRAREVTRLFHPSIATLFDVGEDDDRVYLVFEYVPGELLGAVIAGHPLNPRRAVEFGVQLADALAEAHAESLIHGDIRPDTILVTPKDRVKLLDFGMSAFTRGAPTTLDERSREGPVSDQGEARGAVAEAGRDIFALGYVLFEMLTGRSAFRAPTGRAVPPPSTFNRAVPAELDAIVARALAPDPLARYQSAATLAAELRGVGAILDVRTTASEADFVAETPSRMRLAMRSLLILVVFAGAAGVWGWSGEATSLWRRWFGSPPPSVLVVMPFDVEDTTPTIVADGIAEDLMTRLGTMGVRVVGRSLLRAHRGRNPRVAARDMGAAVALTGTIRGDGDQIALVIALIEADTGVELWRRTVSTSKAQLLVTEASLAEAVADTLGVVAVGQVSAAHARAASRVVNAVAYDRYLEGRDADARGDLRAAIRLYEEATTTDGSLAEGYAALATASYRELVRSARLDDEDAWRRLRRAAENAIAADPDLPAAHQAVALAAPTFGEAVVSLRRAIELDPSRGELYAELGDQVVEFDPDSARSLYRTSLALDSGHMGSVAALARLHINSNQFVEADEQIARGRKLSPSALIWNTIQGHRDFIRSQATSAPAASHGVAVGERDPAAGLLHVRALTAAGRLKEAQEAVARVVREHPAFCEARAVRARLLLEAGRRAEAREETGQILAGSASSESAARARCAALAAAAAGDAGTAGFWLRQIAETESLLRMWALQLDGVSGQAALVRGWSPWHKVAADPAVRKGRDAIQARYARLRDEVAPLLPGVPSP